MGALRPSPPITVIAIVIAGLASLVFVGPRNACLFTPDGHRRTLGSAFVSADPCDVWAGIVPEKPVGTIEIPQETPEGSRLVARISPDGSGFVAVVPPAPGGLSNPIDRIDNPDLADFAAEGPTFAFAARTSAYRVVRDAVAPLRDYQGFESDSPGPSLRRTFELDDRRTRRIVCRNRLNVMPVSKGEVIVFRAKGDAIPSYVLTPDNCADAAQISARARIDRAVKAIVTATGRADQIRRASERQYPFCEAIAPKTHCIWPIL